MESLRDGKRRFIPREYDEGTIEVLEVLVRDDELEFGIDQEFAIVFTSTDEVVKAMAKEKIWGILADYLEEFPGKVSTEVCLCCQCGVGGCRTPDPACDPYSVPLCEACLELWVNQDNYRDEMRRYERD